MNRSLRHWSQTAAALGFLSISLTGEMAPGWIAAAWGAWILGFFMDQRPDFQRRLRRIETWAVVAMLGFLVVDFFILRFTFFVSIAHFLLLFQMIKLFGIKDRKDSFQIFLFSFLQILASCTLSVDAWHAGVLLAMIPTATAALFWSQMSKDCEEAGAAEEGRLHERLHRMAVLICLTALPLNVMLTAVVFVLFPRLTFNASLPGFGNPHAGYTDQMNLSQKGILERNSALVLWMNFTEPQDRLHWDGYLRGEVLSQFDGRQWSVSNVYRQRQITPDTNGVFFLASPGSLPVIHEVVTLADASAGTLFISGKPLRVIAPLPALSESEGGALRWLVPWKRPLHYEVIAGPLSDTQVLPIHLALPALPLGRVAQLARQVAGDGAPLAQARRIEEYLSKKYRYSTDFGDHISQNPVDYFLFDHRQGACGHFASAMAVMLRLQKIPSRLVAGYYKGEWNEPAQSIVMREQNAHAWVEAYIPDHGWMSFDPTPVPPEESSSRINLMHALRQYWDYGSLQWNHFIIQYDLYSQVRAYQRIKGTSGRFGQSVFSWWSTLQGRFNRYRPKHSGRDEDHSDGNHVWPSGMRMTAFLVLALASLLLITRKRRVSGNLSVRFYSRFLERMARAGHPKAPHETGWEFAKRLSDANPSMSRLAQETTVRYYQVRFGKNPL